MSTTLTTLRIALLMVLAMTVVTGMVYPAVVTVCGRVFFPRQAGGSLMIRDGRVIGSELIGQPFDDPRYFWGRPSATGPVPYNAAASGGSNLGPDNPALMERIHQRILALQKEQALTQRPDDPSLIPVDLVTASGSGLDPHISPAAAYYQASRVARLRGLDGQKVLALIDSHIEPRQFGVLGEPRVNVLALNLALDQLR